MNPFISFAAVLMLAVSSTQAVIIAPFPGLTKLIEEADAIAIEAIQEQIPGTATIGWTSYRCFVHQTLKGDLTEGQRVNLTLFDTRSSFVSPFAPNSTHIAFLSTNGNGGESPIRNLQYEGSILRLSPFGHEREPDGWNLERKIKILLERSIAYWDREQQREKELLLAAITGMSSPRRRELEKEHRSVWDSTQHEKSIRISPNVDFDGITANAIVSYQPDGTEWTIQINLLAEDRADIEKESPPKLKVFNPAGAPLKVVGDNGYSDIGHLFVMYWVTAKSVEEIAEAELEFKGLKRRVIFRPNGSEVPTGDNQVEFRGSVGAGEKFEHRFAEKYRFVLDPTEFGWTIRIFEEGRDEDLSRLTPPLHFVPNPREIEGWHFRNKLNTGPNSEKLADEGVNAPQHERQFIFSPEVGRTIQGPDARLSPSPSEIDQIKSFGQGVLTITDLKLTPPKRGEHAKILKMSFRCVISLSTRNPSDLHVFGLIKEWGEDAGYNSSYDQEHPLCKQLVNMGPTAVPGLIRAIAGTEPDSHPNTWIRNIAAFTLRKLLVGAEPAESQKVVPELVALLHSTNVAVRQCGASLLNSIGPIGNAAEADLFPLLSDRSTRKQAALALTSIGADTTRLVPELIPLLDDFDAEVRRTGMFCLERLGPKASSAEPLLLPFLQSTNVTLRAAAATAIRAINPDKTQFVEDALEAAKREDQRRFEARFRADVGLYCEAVPETNSVEQGMPLKVSISFFARPAELPPGVKNLNTFWMREFLRLHLTNQNTGRAFILNLEEFYDIGIPEDNLSKIEPLDGRRIGPWKMEFRLVRLRDELAPGRYTCAIEFAYPKGPHKYWHLYSNRPPREWEKFGFWSGRISSAPFVLEIREEQPRQVEFIRPKSPRLEKADDGTYQLVFKKGDVEKVVRNVHNGCVFGERVENPDSSSSLSGPSDWGREDSILKIPPGKKRIRFRATVFETSEMPDHFWQPQRGIYNILWEVNFETNLTEVISTAK